MDFKKNKTGTFTKANFIFYIYYFYLKYKLNIYIYKTNYKNIHFIKNSLIFLS